jgi:hypothetical protein
MAADSQASLDFLTDHRAQISLVTAAHGVLIRLRAFRTI